jgi:hypothetical protein
VTHGTWIGHHDLDPGLLVQSQGGIQTIQSRRFHADANLRGVVAQKTQHLLVTRRGVGELR